MARLEVSWPDGRSEYVKITHRKPVSIGSHSVSDVVVEDADVAALACRIAWNGDDYEAVAAADADIVVNEKAIRRKSLKDGDELSIGALIIRLERGSEKRFQRRALENDSRDGPLADDDSGNADAQAADHEGAAPQRNTPARDDKASDNEREANGKFAEIDERAYDEIAEEEILDRETKSRIRSRLNARSQRPGQQDATRSPLVYGLAGGVVVLIVATIALTLFIRGQSIEQQFQGAVASVEASRYSEAAQKLTRFIASHPVHPLADRAQRLLAITEVDKQIRGASPDWPAGYSGLNSVINEFRDDEDFSTLHGDIAERAGLIALGAGTDAGRKRDRNLVGLSELAEAMLAKYSPDAIPPETLLVRIVNARNDSRDRLVQLDVLDEFLSRMTHASESKKHLEVLTIGRQVREADAKLGDDNSVRQFIATAIESLRDQVQTISSGEFLEIKSREAREATQQWSLSPIAVVDRAVGEAKPSGTPVFVWTADTYFAVDAASGDPIWWQTWPDSFAPAAIEIPRRAVAAFDRNQNALVIADRDAGEVVRSITLPDVDVTPLGPTIAGGVAFVPHGQLMLRVDLDAGEVTGAIDIGQPTLAKPTIVRTRSGLEALLVVGSRETAYLVDAKSMKLIEMFVVGHQYGAIAAEPIAAAEFVIMAVNRPTRDDCRLLLLSLNEDDVSQPTLGIVDEVTVPGLVLDVPVLRGRDLFVASSTETVAVYTVSDENGGELTPGPAFTAGRREDLRAATYLLADADREFWMAGRRLRRLRATPEAIRPIGNSLPLGSPVASPTLMGSDVYPASRRGTGSTATLSRVNIDDFRERWQLHLESNAIAMLPSSSNDNVCVVTERGDVVRVDLAQAQPTKTPISTSATTRLASSPNHVSTVDNRLAAVVGDELVLIDANGRAARRVSLGSPATLPVVSWKNRFIVPVRGKIKVFQPDGREALSEFWLSQGPNKSTDWQSVIVIDDTHLVTLDSSGSIRLLTVVEGESPHLAETLSVIIAEAKSVVLAPDRNSLYVSNGRQISQLDARSLAVVSESILSFSKVRSLQTINGTSVVLGERDGEFFLSKLPAGPSVSLPSQPIGDVTPSANGFLVTCFDRVLLFDTNLEQIGNPIPVSAKPSGSALRNRDQIILPLENGFLASWTLLEPTVAD